MMNYEANFHIGQQVLKPRTFGTQEMLEKCVIAAVRVAQEEPESYIVEYKLQNKRGWHNEVELQAGELLVEEEEPAQEPEPAAV